MTIAERSALIRTIIGTDVKIETWRACDLDSTR